MHGSVFLTGGTGYLGSHLRRELEADDASVTLLVRPDTDIDSRPNESVVRGDVTHQIEIADAETVIHLAAQTSVDGAIEEPTTAWKVNATGTVHALEAARAASVDRFLFVSTASVYGPPESLPIDESHPLNAVEPYGASKLAADRMVRAYHQTSGLDTVTVRPFNTFGPAQPIHNVVPTIITQALDGGPVDLGNLTPSRDFLYVEDALDGLLTVLERGSAGEVYNVGSGEATTIYDLARIAIDLVDPQLDIESASNRQRNEQVEIEKHVADMSKIAKLGWSPDHKLKEGMRKTVEYFRA
jgi:nucleoside-diphosphate-sugar epimerase